MIAAGAVLALWFLSVVLDEDMMQGADGGPHLYAYDTQAQCEQSRTRLQEREQVIWVGACRPGPGATGG